MRFGRRNEGRLELEFYFPSGEPERRLELRFNRVRGVEFDNVVLCNIVVDAYVRPLQALPEKARKTLFSKSGMHTELLAQSGEDDDLLLFSVAPALGCSGWILCEEGGLEVEGWQPPSFS